LLLYKSEYQLALYTRKKHTALHEVQWEPSYHTHNTDPHSKRLYNQSLPGPMEWVAQLVIHSAYISVRAKISTKGRWNEEGNTKI